LTNLLDNGRNFPLPNVLGLMKKLWELLDAAARRVDDVPCLYLGACKQHNGAGTAPRNAFEPDPAKFPEHAKPDGWTSHGFVWYEWPNVKRTGQSGLVPHRVCIQANKIVSNQRRVPHHPLNRLAPSKLHFDVEFMQEAATRKDQRITYRGVALSGSKLDFYLDVPNGGKDIQDTPVYWTLPGGRSECCSIRELRELSQIQLEEPQSREQYAGVAKLMGFSFLGMLDTDVVNEFKRCPGTIRGGEWKELGEKSKKPANEMSPCWWVTVQGEQDAPPSFVCRSLAALLLELEQHQRATPTKVVEELTSRRENNKKAIEALRQHEELWLWVGHACAILGRAKPFGTMLRRLGLRRDLGLCQQHVPFH